LREDPSVALESSYVLNHLINTGAGPIRGADSASGRRESTIDLSLTMTEALARAMEARDRATHQHAQRVQRYAAALAREAGIGAHPLLEAIDIAALLHDVGKLGIPDRVLDKPGPLTTEEYEQVKQHVIIGADILSAAAFPGPLALLVRHHHERWDSTGYPDGLRGEAIPIGARVLAIVDCYDALTSDRPYRRALSHSRAVAMIHEGRGTMYDPDIADVFLRIVQRLRFECTSESADRAHTPVGSLWLRTRAV
jgi:putative nucleotidyltransferase with HDIG domain